MTVEELNKVKDFSIKWIECNIGKSKKYKQKLIDAVTDLFELNEDGRNSWQIQEVRTWDSGTYGGMSSLMDDLIEYDNVYSFSKKAKSDFICTIRVAIDLLIYQSGGVWGFSVGDVRKFVTKYPEYYQILTKKLNQINYSNLLMTISEFGYNSFIVAIYKCKPNN